MERMSFSKTIEIVDISPVETVTTGKKPYGKIEVAFKEDGKIGGKKLLSFQNEEIFKKVQQYKRGDVLTIETEKDKNDYWQWTSIEAGTTSAAAGGTGGNPSKDSPRTSGAQTGRVTGSNYATAEERAQTQLRITRQSSLTAALKVMELNKVKEVKLEEVLDIAKFFTAYVYEKEPNQSIVDMDNDIPV